MGLPDVFMFLTRLVVLLPVWLITRCMQPFLRETHPWKHKRITPLWWARCATQLSAAFGMGFWFLGLTNGLAFWMISRGHSYFALVVAWIGWAFVFWFLRKVPYR
jgi:hypothetical protein